MKRLSTSVKAIAIASLLAAAPGLVLAGHNYKGDMKGEACPTPLMLMDGFYVGAGIGFEAYRVRANYNEILAGGVSTFNVNPPLNVQGVNGGIFGGYGMYFNHVYYLGAELHGNFGDMSNSYNANVAVPGTPALSYNTQVKVQTTWGVALLPGYKVNDSSLFYLRVGYKQAQIKTSESISGPGIVGGSTSNTDWTNGVSYGAGIETAFWPNWSVRGEYTHTEYNSTSDSPIVIGGTAVSTVGTTFFPSDNQFMLSVLYHFA